MWIVSISLNVTEKTSRSSDSWLVQSVTNSLFFFNKDFRVESNEIFLHLNWFK